MPQNSRRVLEKKGPHAGRTGPWGPLGLFRSRVEWKSISNGELLRKQAHSEMKTVAEEIHPKANGQKLERN